MRIRIQEVSFKADIHITGTYFSFFVYFPLMMIFYRFLFLFLDFPRVSIDDQNPLRIEEGDTAVMSCQVTKNDIKFTFCVLFVESWD